VTVTDSENPAKTANANLSITISAPPLSVTTLTLPGGTLGTAYNQTLGATGGITPYAWSISVGALPAGLTLNGARVRLRALRRQCDRRSTLRSR